MSLAAIVLSGLLVGAATWLALRQHFVAALAVTVASSVPLLVTSTAVKAVFAWVALIGLVALGVVVANGLGNREGVVSSND